MVDEDTSEFIKDEGCDENVEVAKEDSEYVIFVVKRILYTSKEKGLPQRNNIFQAYCSILGKVCQLIIDNESCDNIISQSLLQYLNLSNEPHPKPYKLG